MLFSLANWGYYPAGTSTGVPRAREESKLSLTVLLVAAILTQRDLCNKKGFEELRRQTSLYCGEAGRLIQTLNRPKKKGKTQTPTMTVYIVVLGLLTRHCCVDRELMKYIHTRAECHKSGAGTRVSCILIVHLLIVEHGLGETNNYNTIYRVILLIHKFGCPVLLQYVVISYTIHYNPVLQ